MNECDKVFVIVPFGKLATNIEDKKNNYEIIFEAPTLYDDIVGKEISCNISTTLNHLEVGRRFISYEKILKRLQSYMCRDVIVTFPNVYNKEDVYMPKNNKDAFSILLQEQPIRMTSAACSSFPLTIDEVWQPDISKVWNRFDGIYLICAERYKDRLVNVQKELERINIWSRVELQLDLPNPFIDYLADKIIFANSESRKSFRCGYSHYKTILNALHSRKEHILLLEDDLIFLKDKKRIAQYINSLPDNYDLAMLDKTWTSNSIKKDISDVADWDEYDTFNSSGCYALSRKGMERFVTLYEEGLKSGSLRNNDNYFYRKAMGESLNLYASFPNVAIQTFYKTCNSHLDWYYTNHIKHGLKLEDYNFSSMPNIGEIASLRGIDTKKSNTIKNGYRIGTTPKVYYGHRQQSDLQPKPKGWNW